MPTASNGDQRPVGEAGPRARPGGGGAGAGPTSTRRCQPQLEPVRRAHRLRPGRKGRTGVEGARGRRRHRPRGGPSPWPGARGSADPSLPSSPEAGQACSPQGHPRWVKLPAPNRAGVLPRHRGGSVGAGPRWCPKAGEDAPAQCSGRCPGHYSRGCRGLEGALGAPSEHSMARGHGLRPTVLRTLLALMAGGSAWRRRPLAKDPRRREAPHRPRPPRKSGGPPPRSVPSHARLPGSRRPLVQRGRPLRSASSPAAQVACGSR